MTEFEIAYFTNFPIWVTIAWTVSVWGLFLATIALLLSIRNAFILFLISLIGTLVYVLYAFGLSEGREAMIENVLRKKKTSKLFDLKNKP